MEKIKITNPKQFEKLVEEMEKNPSLARGFRRGTVPSNFKEQWESVATVLNAHGPPSRTGDGWQKIWRDLKFKTKKKMVSNKAECKATGGGLFKQHILSPLEEAVANLLQFEKHLNPQGMMQGVPTSECELPQIEDDVTFDMLESIEVEIAPTSSRVVSTAITTAPSVTTTAPSVITTATTTNSQNPLKRTRSSTTKKGEIPMERNELLQRHSNDQAKLLTEISNSTSSIKRSLRDIRDIEEKRLKLEIEKSKREEDIYKIDMKIKKIELSIKEKELELLNS